MSRRWMILPIFLLLIVIVGLLFLNKKQMKYFYSIESDIKETSDYVQSITSITTTSKKLNNLLENHIKEQTAFFHEQVKKTKHPLLVDRDELNIDFTFEIIDSNTWNISYTTLMTGPTFTYPYKQIDCWTWNPKTEKEKKLEELLTDSIDFTSWKHQIFQEVKKECSSCIPEDDFDELFTEDFKTFRITETGLIFYFNPFLFHEDYYDIIPVVQKVDGKVLLKDKKQIKNKNNKGTEKNIIDPNQPVVALTFDDGPSKYTEEILEILNKNQVNATFFVVGNKIDRYQEILRKSVEDGNELGNHSYNHQWLSRLSTSELMNQIDKTQKKMEEKLHYTPRYLRPTYGSITNRIRKNTNLEIALWTIDTKDWKIHNINRIVERATENIEDGDIILMHDIFERSKEALKKIIPELKKQGFQLVTMSELEEVNLLREFQKSNEKRE